MSESTRFIDVQEVRRRPRFKLRGKLSATFSGQPATVTDISAEGLGLQHSAPIKINASGAIRIESEENLAGTSFRARIRWSRLSRTSTPEGKYLYTSGLEIEEASDAAAGLLGRLIRALGEPDRDSLQAKKKALQEKALARSSAPMVLSANPAAPKNGHDHALLIRNASLDLANHPESAQEWYNRAKFSLAKRNLISDASQSSPYRREVIVIWEYLGGKVDLDVIARELDSRKSNQSADITA
jgi:hypothetical protein